MKKLQITLLIAVFLSYGFDGLMAQSGQTKHDQVALAKQIEGLWRIETNNKDTAIFFEMESFGTGFIGSLRWVANGEVYNETKRLYGYDESNDRYFGLSTKGNGGMGMDTFWFTSESTFEGYNFPNPLDQDKISRRYIVEFKTKDLWYQTNIRQNRPNTTEILIRVKNEH